VLPSFSHWEYLILNLLIISGPLYASFDKKLNFISEFRNSCMAIIPVASYYIVWDSIAVVRGHWSFNPEYILGIHFLELPIEEWFFFISVPYASLLIYSVIKFYNKESITYFKFNVSKFSILFAATGLIIWLGKGYEYTGLSFLTCALFFLLDSLSTVKLSQSLNFWSTQGIILVCNFIFNSYLTGRPVLLYNQQFFLGLRVGSIPLEDFFYGFGLTSLCMLCFELLLKNKEKQYYPSDSSKELSESISRL